MNPNGTQAIFIPSSLVPTGDMQTIFCSYVATRNIFDNVEYEREILTAEDGGTVSIDWTPPLSKEPLDDRPIAFILHGLTGGSHEHYVRITAQLLISKKYNFRVVVINNRGCKNSNPPFIYFIKDSSGTPLTSPKLFNASNTSDFRMVVNLVKERAPASKLFGVGFSLGSNLVAKYIGEESENCPLTAAVSICNPFNFTK
ncbi:Embryogenesis-associated protein EMB8 [Smittium culicis]|uniref:Embryogenesis-associated protein EMB8 n=1 Tax=Smittium culicis TaxID=133412 RepID=A0A1R1XUW5_9FUNG|nr:Embryogenesis-associated protein EMB8 [Smittium culicis]OMJ18457.1 Embryogenesis-associated protein EMB8 [Smittium culicis]